MYEGRNPGQTFDNNYYLANHQDVAAAVEGGAFRSGYEHYMIHGMTEGRIGGEIVAATSGETLIGNAGVNILKGNQGKDILIAVNPDAANPGMGEVDWLTGGGNADTFVLGDATGVYYRHPNDAAEGMKDYAMITDFQSSEDVIQLHGSAADYRLETTSQELPAGTAIYQINGVNNEQKDLIAVVQNVSNLNLDESYFAFA
jgi:Ca2+-binding RTX toxin-like protein